ncbi:MAG: HAMP domain-containing sensor histidine kinase, partial [Bacteroidales bacterium]
MKLFEYTYKTISLILFVLLSIWGAIFYTTMIKEVIDETDDTLDHYKHILIGKVLQDPSLLETKGNLMTHYQFSKLSPEVAKQYLTHYYDSSVYIEGEDEYEPVRVLATSFMVDDGTYYELKIMLSTLERNDMIKAILLHILVLYFLFFIITAIANRILLKRIFKPLHLLLNWISQIKLGKESQPLKSNTQIEEFKLLNKAALEMNERTQQVYKQQKEFIENAAHELQTPLAIVAGKLELFVGNNSFTEAQFKDLEQMGVALKRAIKINKSLLLLSRIENRQYTAVSTQNLSRIIQETLSNMTEIYVDKRIEMITEYQADFILEMNEELSNSLIVNLLKNSFIYTPINGKIIIKTNQNSIEFINSGVTPLDQEKIFDRFYYQNARKEGSSGIGLSIVKSIIQRYHLTLIYQWQAPCYHHFTIKKEEKKKE